MPAKAGIQVYVLGLSMKYKKPDSGSACAFR
jgi:hypothetical protein